ncbi:nitroreductase/quinone reductase family protein [Nonomuraea sp. NPDC050790]|uniref:nitroreductase/quinone reductase family protein n=1 Tax=Nonomuraea sp. NPDC050790 TaxID=3364371 RepID=UPI0037B6B224
MSFDFNTQIIEEFRANRGRVGGPFEGARLLLLSTTGVRSGEQHTVPLGYLPDGGEQVLVIASANGAARHPDWFHNLVAEPVVNVEDGIFTYEARATVLEGAERDAAWARAVEADPAWGDYQARTSRVIPVVALRQTGGGPPPASSFGEALRMIHDAFRRELVLIRKEIAESGPGLGAQLRVNCLTLCQGLHIHHSHEDRGLFPAVSAQHPELAEVMDRLRDEHEKVAALLARLQEVISGENVDSPSVLKEVEELASAVEQHLDYEEEQLIPVLDGA